MKMSWRENKTGDSYQTAQETDEERKASLEKIVATNCSSSHGDEERKARLKKMGYHSDEVSPGDRGRKKS